MAAFSNASLYGVPNTPAKSGTTATPTVAAPTISPMVANPNLPQNLTPAQFTAATGQAPATPLTAAQLAAQNASKSSPSSAPTGSLIGNGLPVGGGGDGGNAQGANIGAAPAGAKQSSNGLWYDSGGNAYTTAPAGGGGASTPSTGLPGSTGGFSGPDGAYGNARNALTPTGPLSESDFFNEIYQQLAPVISAINGAETSAETAAYAAGTNQQNDLSGALGARGLAGSGEASREAANTNLATAANVAQAKQAQATAMQNVMNLAIPEAYTAYKDAQTRNDTNAQAYIAQTQKNMSDSLSGLASSGLTLDDLKSSNPQQYQQLLQYANGDPNQLNAMFVSAAQANILGDPIQVGNTLVYKVKSIDPTTGQPTVKTMDVTLPTLPSGYKVTSYNQSTNGTVAYIAFPTDSFGNQTIDPSKPNNGVISGTLGGSADGTNPNVGTVPDPTSTAITAQTGLSINAFNFLTQGTAALSRMPNTQRALVQSEAQTWANNNGIDLSTFASQYKANNDTLASNVSRFNNTKIAEGEVTGTLSNLDSTAIDKNLGSVNIANVGKILAGQQVNDPTANEYAFYFNDLKNSLSYFYAAQQGKSSPDIIDNEDAANVIVGGLSSGGISGLQDAVSATTAKMKTVLQSAVDGAQQNVWNLFGVGQNYASSHAAAAASSGTYPAGSIVQDGQGNKYTVGPDGNTLSPYSGT